MKAFQKCTLFEWYIELTLWNLNFKKLTKIITKKKKKKKKKKFNIYKLEMSIIVY